MAYVHNAPWYYSADGTPVQAVNNGDGWEYLEAPVDDDGRHVQVIDDPAMVSQLNTQALGFNPDDKRVNQDGSVSIMNPQTGQYEQAVAAGESGAYMPISMAQAQGLPIYQMAREPKETSGHLQDIVDSGAWMPFAAAAGVNALGGANMFGTAGLDGATLSAADAAAPTAVATDTALVGGAEGALGGAAELAGGASGASGGAISSGFSGAGSAAANAALGLGSGSVLGDYAAPSLWQTAQNAISGTPSAKGILGASPLDYIGPAANVASTGTALSRLWNSVTGGNSSSVGDLAKILGNVGAAGLGAYASNQQAGALTDLANKYMGFGAPSRDRYEASFAPGFDLSASDPAYKGALDSTMDATLRRLSTQGNPFGNPGGLIEANKAVVNSTALPALQEYRRLNAGTGGLANMNAAAPATANAAIGASGNVYNAIGSGIADITNPKTSFADLIKKYGGGVALA
jgi:hypothetical protein